MTEVPTPKALTEVPDDEQRVVLRAIVSTIREHGYSPDMPALTALCLHNMGYTSFEIEQNLDTALKIVREGR